MQALQAREVGELDKIFKKKKKTVIARDKVLGGDGGEGWKKRERVRER